MDRMLNQNSCAPAGITFELRKFHIIKMSQHLTNQGLVYSF